MIMNMYMGNIKIILGVKISCYSPFKCEKASIFKENLGGQSDHLHKFARRIIQSWFWINGVSALPDNADSESALYQTALILLSISSLSDTALARNQHITDSESVLYDTAVIYEFRTDSIFKL